MYLINRRELLGAIAAGTLSAGITGVVKRRTGTRMRIGLNAYSFNKPLIAGQMDIAQVIDYCAQQSLEGVDLTGYYFPGYPTPPADEYIHRVKRTAFQNGVTIIGTGVRNDFALPDPAQRGREVQLVKSWIDVAAKLGGSMVRVFSGKALPSGQTFDAVFEWMVPAFAECAAYGEKRGVLVGLQHHDDVLKTAEQTIRVVKAVNSDWFTVILDVGSLRKGDPYEEIETLLPYASNWQLKEHVWFGSEKKPIDLARVRRIIERVGYRGFIPIEALGEGDPAEVVTAFLTKVRTALG